MGRFEYFPTIYYAQQDLWKNKKNLRYPPFKASQASLRPTTEFETVSKDPKWDFQIVKGRIGSMAKDKYAHIANFPLTSLNTHWGTQGASCSVVGLRHSSRAWKHFEGDFSYTDTPRWLWWFRMFYRILSQNLNLMFGTFLKGLPNWPGVALPPGPQGCLTQERRLVLY